MFEPWAIRHLDLRTPLPALEVSPGLGGLVLIFWWADIPLGRHDLYASQLPLPATHLREIALGAITPAVGDYVLGGGFGAPMPEKAPPPRRPTDFDAVRSLRAPLEAVESRIAQREARAPVASVSVVVCTRERPDDLRACLESLQMLDPFPEEIVVVDNAPRSAATRQVVEAMPDVRYVLEPRPGLSAARNAGLRHSTGDLIAFTDDDVRVHSKWVGRLRTAFSDPDVDAVTGLILPDELETPAQLFFERHHAGFGRNLRAVDFDRGFFERMRRYAVPVWQLGAGANMAFRRRVFEELGGFDERLGAGASGCSEDSEMWYRILAAGGRCRYEPTAVVSHIHRRDMEGLDDQMYQYMRGHITALLAQYEKHRDAGNLRRAFLTLPAYYGRGLIRRALRKPGVPPSLREQVRGTLAGFGYYLRHRAGAHPAPLIHPPS